MAPSEPKDAQAPSTSSTLREQGNALYRAGKISLACKKYMEAAKADPADPIPPRNLSAGYYELGAYTKCITTAKDAISLLDVDLSPADQAQVEKLQARISKAEIHSFKSGAAEKKEVRNRILEKLPRYKPSMFTSTEYFTVGHDDVATIFEADMFKAFAPETKEVSFFLGGVGDARAVLQTFAVISESERLKGSPERKYHFTINDISKSALARNVVVWMLLSKLTELNEEDEKEMVLNTVFFIYLSTLMPRYAFEMLEETISNAIDTLEKGDSPLKWLFLHEKDIPSYLAAFRHWLGEGKQIFTSNEIVDKVALKMSISEAAGHMRNEGNAFYKNEKRLYIESAVLFPSNRVLQLHDPGFLEMIRKYSTSPRKNSKIFKKYLEENWHFNTTLMDKDWYADLQGKHMFDLGFNPFEAIDHFAYLEVQTKPNNPDRLFEHMKPFFLESAKAIEYLGERLKVEAILGDYVDAAEKIQFGLYKTVTRPKEFPILYDRIHLSNVPDYTHGHVTTFVHAMPILRRGPASSLRATCLRNSDSWRTVEDYLADYNQIPDTNTLEALAQVKIVIRENNALPYPMADYTFYTWSKPGPHSFSALLPRKQFTKWFCSLFFRLALPMRIDITLNSKIIFSPLNLCILFRLISQLRGFGYPSHWLSEALLNIIHNTVVTTARPPRAKPMKPADVKRNYPDRKLCTTPFSHELGTLASLFQPLLPFKLTSPLIPNTCEIYKYTFKLEGYMNYIAQPSCLILVFIKESLFPDNDAPQSVLSHLRLFLDPSTDEVEPQLSGKPIDQLREEGARVWSSFSWDGKDKVASAWMSEGFVKEIVENKWSVGIWRTDIWDAVCMPQLVGVEDVVMKEERWVV